MAFLTILEKSQALMKAVAFGDSNTHDNITVT
jgi:hypothetical protein